MKLDLAREAIAARQLLMAVRGSGEVPPEDEVLVLDSETNLLEAIDEALGEIDELELMQEGGKASMARQAARLARFAQRQEVIRQALLEALERADIEGPLVRPTATVSVGKGRRKIHITDAGKLPPHLMRTRDPEPNLIAIHDEYKNGRPVPGTEQGNAQPVLIIRRT